ncbi:MmcQ/YjbR family DNA-binding protein [Virgibacillus oceani]
MEKALRELCKSKVGSIEKFIEDWGAYNYTVGGKMFAIIGKDKYKKHIISLKCEPEISEELRNEHEAINPGYYLNKNHWNSIYYNEDVPRELIYQLIDKSYSLVFQSLPKKKQREIG